jgi:hypothetical protein
MNARCEQRSRFLFIGCVQPARDELTEGTREQRLLILRKRAATLAALNYLALGDLRFARLKLRRVSWLRLGHSDRHQPRSDNRQEEQREEKNQARE